MAIAFTIEEPLPLQGLFLEANAPQCFKLLHRFNHGNILCLRLEGPLSFKVPLLLPSINVPLPSKGLCLQSAHPFAFEDPLH
jgi:hypothetical protein